MKGRKVYHLQLTADELTYIIEGLANLENHYLRLKNYDSCQRVRNVLTELEFIRRKE